MIVTLKVLVDFSAFDVSDCDYILWCDCWLLQLLWPIVAIMFDILSLLQLQDVASNLTVTIAKTGYNCHYDCTC